MPNSVIVGVANDEEPDVFVWLVQHDCLTKELKATLYRAIGDFLKTQEGRDAIARYSDPEFFWSDVIDVIPQSYWKPYGISFVGLPQKNDGTTIVVDIDENLAGRR